MKTARYNNNKYSFISGGEEHESVTVPSSGGDVELPHLDLQQVDLQSRFLPDSLPAGDPVHFALPVWLAEPEDNFVVKSKSAQLTCKVRNITLCLVVIALQRGFYKRII